MRYLADVAFDAKGIPRSISWRIRTYTAVPGTIIDLADLMADLTHPLPIIGYQMEVIAVGEPAWRYRLAIHRTRVGWVITSVSSAVHAAA